MPKTLHDIYYDAVATRDPKFDGKFFLGVKTTSIYCRPICPAKPKRENVEFFQTAHHAEKAGYRPCLRCRPECAPDSPHWLGKTALVNRVLKSLGEESTIDLSEDEFARLFGVTARHLRRVVKDEVGKTPKAIARNNRLNLARKLIVETSLPFGEIAFGSGFQSIRRFNDAVKERFKKTPREIRKLYSGKKEKHIIELSLSYRPPLDWEGCLNFYKKHKIAFVENFDDNQYQRFFWYNKKINFITVNNDHEKHCLLVKIDTKDYSTISFVLRRIKEMFDLSLDPVFIANAFDTNKTFKQLYNNHPGLRLIGTWDCFELAISTILGQLVSVKRATDLTEQLIQNYGTPTTHESTSEKVLLFPTPKILANARLDKLGMPEMKKVAIRELSKKVLNREIHFSNYQDPALFKQQLMAIKGIGPWTADYIALRAIGDTNAFPPGDAYLDKHFKLEQVNELAPWRGYLVSYLYKYGLDNQLDKEWS